MYEPKHPDEYAWVKCVDTHGQVVTCLSCGHKLPMRSAWADRNGRPWRAYYCNECKETHSTHFPG